MWSTASKCYSGVICLHLSRTAPAASTSSVAWLYLVVFLFVFLNFIYIYLFIFLPDLMFPHLARIFFLAHFAKYRALLEAVEVAPFLGTKSSLEDFFFLIFAMWHYRTAIDKTSNEGRYESKPCLSLLV